MLAKSFKLLMVVILALSFLSSTQAVSASANATFTFTSTPNPSNYEQEVTFTITATGDYVDTLGVAYPPFGTVVFYDNGTVIDGCDYVPLNRDGAFNPKDLPAVCKTKKLEPGAHTITAYYSQTGGFYDNATLTLAGGQAVNDPIPLTITPTSLPDLMWWQGVHQQLTATGGDGSYYWTYTGEMPSGISLFNDEGFLEGMPGIVGTYAFTLTADDRAGARGSQTYTWNINKATPSITVADSYQYLGTTDAVQMWATVQHPFNNSNSFLQPEGMVSFSIGGVGVPGCSGADAAVTEADGIAYCNYTPTGSETGPYTYQADFTPDVSAAPYYTTASGTANVAAYAGIDGTIFQDTNRNGVRDIEPNAGYGWHVYLDKCDGTHIFDTYTDDNGDFHFGSAPAGICLQLRPDLWTGYIQTTPLADFTLTGHQTFAIGVFQPQLVISSDHLLGSLGQEFNQVVTVSGGTAPYTITENNSTLPDTIQYEVHGNAGGDTATITFSGTPTVAGNSRLDFQVSDSAGAVNYFSVTLDIRGNGRFTFVSSPNPSASGQAVTFTFTGSGDLVDPDSQQAMPPFGVVSFYDGADPIAGCEQVWLNFDTENFTPLTNPAVCATSALTDGAHTIKAVFQSLYLYNDATLTLTQQVGGAAPSLSISPNALADGVYGAAYDQSFTASGGMGPYAFTIAADPGSGAPIGAAFDPTGRIYGTPEETGSFGFTITATDSSSPALAGSKHYAWTVNKAAPTVTVNNASALTGGNVPLKAAVSGATFAGAQAAIGTFTYSVNGAAVAACTNIASGSDCPFTLDQSLAPGAYTIRVDFTPDSNASPYYTGSFGTGTLTVSQGFFIRGTVFNDLNSNKSKDVAEPGLPSWHVYLGDCSGSHWPYASADADGAYVIGPLPTGGPFCVDGSIAELVDGWAYTVFPAKIASLTADVSGANIGISRWSITPQNAPNGSVGMSYNQVFTLRGGIGPYTVTYTDEGGLVLPSGVRASFNAQTGAITLSGKPTAPGEFFFDGKITDAIGQVFGFGSTYSIVGDGSFTFNASPNPSTQGQVVTFTLSASGAGPIPPFGTVTFSDGSTVICQNVPLNYDAVNAGYLAKTPATCATSAFATGSHTIKAAFTSKLPYYRNATRTLTQTVKPKVTTSADLKLTIADSKDHVKPGAALSYTLKLSNLGPNTAQNIKIVDTLDPNTTYVSYSAPKGWTCAQSAGVVTCTGASLAKGAAVNIVINVTVKKTMKSGILTNTATVTSDTPDPVAANNTVTQKTWVDR